MNYNLTKVVLIISAVFPPEPVVSAKLSYDLASELSVKNKVMVVSPKPSRPYGFKFEQIAEALEFDHQILKSSVCPQANTFGRFRENYSFGRAGYGFISKNYKAINKIYAITWPLFAQYFVVRAAKRYKIPVIIHVQDVYPESLTRKNPFLGSLFRLFLLPIDKYVLRNSNEVIVVSEKMSANLIKTRELDKSKVHIIQNWQDEASFIIPEAMEEKNGRSDKHFTFMYLGNIGPIAGVDMLIDAFASAEMKMSRLVIAGSGSMKTTAIKKAQSYHEAKIEFWNVPEGKVAETQSKADVMLLPLKKGNSFSSVPSKLPAYMLSAKPIISSLDENSDTADIILMAGCGWVVPPDDNKALADKMREVSELPEQKLKELGENGRLYALENLSKGANLKKLVDIIEQAGL